MEEKTNSKRTHSKKEEPEKTVPAGSDAESNRRQKEQQEQQEQLEQHEQSHQQPNHERKEERPEVEGILEIQEENNFGFLRFSNFLTSEKDIYVSPTEIRRFNLKTGDKIRGITRLPKEGERFGALLYVLTVNGDEPGVAMRRPDFDDLTPVFPYERLRLEDDPEGLVDQTDRPGSPDRKRAAWFDRGTAESRKDGSFKESCQCY